MASTPKWNKHAPYGWPIQKGQNFSNYTGPTLKCQKYAS